MITEDRGDVSKIALAKMARRVILVTIRDLCRGRLKGLDSYIGSALFTVHRKTAGYPEELDDTLADALLCSEVQRKKICQEVIELLNQWDTQKTPRTNPGG